MTNVESAVTDPFTNDYPSIVFPFSIDRPDGSEHYVDVGIVCKKILDAVKSLSLLEDDIHPSALEAIKFLQTVPTSIQTIGYGILEYMRNSQSASNSNSVVKKLAAEAVFTVDNSTNQWGHSVLVHINHKSSLSDNCIMIDPYMGVMYVYVGGYYHQVFFVNKGFAPNPLY
jgi:uncharacterized protein (DUF302 family)